ncbi:MAG TPA: chloride channel protein [Bacteroidales bacterium]|nr:chloride channel protein [Bacteroidales bacterium]
MIYFKQVANLFKNVFSSENTTKKLENTFRRFNSVRVFETIIWLKNKYLTETSFILILSVLIGFVAGLTAVFLKTAAFSLRSFALTTFDYLGLYLPLGIVPVVGIAMVIFYKKIILKDNSKHGIPAILYAISKQNSQMPAHKMYSSTIGAVFTSGFGGSAGVEAPIISSGSAIGSNIGKFLKLNFKTTSILLACGAAGGMSAIFNTPVTAIVFALEVLLIDLSRFSLIPLLVASVTGAITSNLLLHNYILFDFVVTDTFLTADIPFYSVLGIITGMVSLYFTKTFLYIEKRFGKMKSDYRRFFFGVLGLGILLLLFPTLYGEGFIMIKNTFQGNYALVIPDWFYNIFENEAIPIILFFLFMIFLKVVAAVFTISAGGIGGIFAPALFTGSVTGLLFAYLVNFTGFFRHLSESNFILVGMCGLISGVLHAPLTGLFLIAEITGGYELIVPLMLVSTVSFVVVKYIMPTSIFTHQLVKRGELITHDKDKAVLTFMHLAEVIETDFITVSPTDKLGSLTKAIANSNRNLFPVCNEKDELIGVVLLDNVRDIMFNTSVHELFTVRDLMNIPPAYIFTTDHMDTVMQKFNDSNAWNLPVIDNNKYVGFVSKSKIFSVYRKLLQDISQE